MALNLYSTVTDYASLNLHELGGGKVASYFEFTIDQLVNFDGNMPNEVTVQDKSLLEQVKLIAELEEERSIVFKMIDTILTKRKFNDFFNKNVAAL